MAFRVRKLFGTFEKRAPCFNVKIVLLSRATGSVSIGNLSAFDIIRSKAREIVGDATGDARLLILLPMESK